MSGGPWPRGGLQRIGPKRHPGFLRRGEAESRRHHADDGRGLPVGPHDPPHNTGVAAEPCDPGAVAQHENRRGSWLAVALDERPAHERGHAQNREAIGREKRAGQPLRLTIAHDDVHAGHLERRQLVEGGLYGLPLCKVVDRQVEPLPPSRNVAERDGHNPAAVRDWQPPEEDAVADAEEQRRQANTQSEGNHGGRCEAWLPGEHSSGHPRIGGKSHGALARRRILDNDRVSPGHPAVRSGEPGTRGRAAVHH